MPSYTTSDGDFIVYRFYAGDDLLYVGCTQQFPRRLAHHACMKPWFSTVNRIELSHFGNSLAARRAEAMFIQDERPAFNILVADPEKVAGVGTPRGDGTVCPRCKGPKEHKPGLAYCPPCAKLYRLERRIARGTRPVRTPSITCPRCGGIKSPGPAYCLPCKRQVSQEARKNKKAPPVY